MSKPLKLSICISTFNRAAFIGATLETMISQVTNDCEIVVLDGASTDDTERVVSEYISRCNRLRYIRQSTNNGIDRDYDRAVELAQGEYCWLMSDDDPIKSGAVKTVIGALREDFSLIFVNSEVMDLSLSKTIEPSLYGIESDRVYGSEELDRLFMDMEPYLNYISGVVIKRSIWRDRDRERYYGSLFVFVGVIFQKPLPGKTLVLAEPLIICRLGNTHTFWSNVFEVDTLRWPAVVGSLGISEAAKRKTPGDRWRSLGALLTWRGIGAYSMSEYKRCVRPRLRSARQSVIPVLVAMLPGTIANAICLLYYMLVGNRVWVVLLRQSPFYIRNWGAK